MGDVLTFKNSLPVSDMPGMVEEYLADLRARNKSHHTIRNFRADLVGFMRFYPGYVCGIDAGVLRDYFKGLTTSPATQARKRTALKSFLNWCVENDVINANPMGRLGAVKLPEAQPRFLPMDQVRIILATIEDERDRLLFTLIAETGLRISEALSIRVEDLRLEAKELRVTGKGQRERTVDLVKTESLRRLKAYLKKHGISSGLVFRPDAAKQRYGATDKPIDYSVIAKAWKGYCTSAGVTCTIHQLRHSQATHLINRGVPIEVVAKVLGHKNLQTTRRYATVSDQTVRKALEDVR